MDDIFEWLCDFSNRSLLTCLCISYHHHHHYTKAKQVISISVASFLYPITGRQEHSNAMKQFQIKKSQFLPNNALAIGYLGYPNRRNKNHTSLFCRPQYNNATDSIKGKRKSRNPRNKPQNYAQKANA